MLKIENKVFFMDVDSKNTVNNQIEFVEIEYCSHKKEIDDKTIQRKEHIIIDGTTKKLIIKQDYLNCNTIKEYYIPNQINSLLCQFESVETEKNSESTKPRYKIHIRHKNSKIIEVKNSFSRSDLPLFWEDFVYDVSDIIDNHGIYGDLLDFDLYGKGVREGEYIYCSVIFKNSCQPYYYLTNDNEIEIDDDVLVPFGNTEKIGRVCNIEYFKKENVPISLNAVKQIIRKEKKYLFKKI